MKILIRLLFWVIIPICIGLITYRYLQSNFIEPVNPSRKELSLIAVDPSMTFKQICQMLEEKGIVESSKSLIVLARLSDKEVKITAGEYELSPSMTPKDIYKVLASGNVFKRSFAITDGESIWDIGDKIQEISLLPKEEFNSALTNPSLLVRAGIGAQSFEGYLFPGEYSFSRPITAKKIIWTMLEHGEQNWPKDFSKRANEIGLSRHEVITLASIIQKTSVDPEEQTLISSVFHNRLVQGIKLQSDPTVIYGLKNFSGALTEEDINTPSPYNTYLNFGLPPGPICNPGVNAIRAALYPQETEYLFFGADGMGGFVFSTTLKEHTEALNESRN